MCKICNICTTCNICLVVNALVRSAYGNVSHLNLTYSSIVPRPTCRWKSGGFLKSGGDPVYLSTNYKNPQILLTAFALSQNGWVAVGRSGAFIAYKQMTKWLPLIQMMSWDTHEKPSTWQRLLELQDGFTRS